MDQFGEILSELVHVVRLVVDFLTIVAVRYNEGIPHTLIGLPH